VGLRERDEECTVQGVCDLRYGGRSPMEVRQGERQHYGVGDGSGNVRAVYSATSQSDGLEWYGRHLPIYGRHRSGQPVGGEGEFFV
jgi:hypothetical protein